MTDVVEFTAAGRLPVADDNVAIAVRDLPAGTWVRHDGDVMELRTAVMEGHRFAVRTLEAGEPLLSWGLPFGTALRAISPGEYVCNQGMLDALEARQLDRVLPRVPNFEDRIAPFVLDPERIMPGTQVPPHREQLSFQGFARRAGRGVGTRNYIVVMGTSARTGSLARVLVARMREVVARHPELDGVVAVDHTEGGGDHPPHNLDLVRRALTGFCVHPNVGAVLALDYGVEAVTNRQLRNYADAQGYPLHAVPHAFVSVHRGTEEALTAGERQIRAWLENTELGRRSTQPFSALRLALQCGGSDAFSGISGNPLAAWVAREIVRYGGAANLAESDELMGAEAYVLQNVRDAATAVRFMEMLRRFRERMAWHGVSPESNPSAGNKYRGLYNIALKSIGAARKRAPDVRLDDCIEYAEPMRAPGFYFMDSPGNDLESIAGQVASGANLIFFVTGNGSVTNFPFVPTVKLVTTSGRYQLLADDMDVNAGAFQEGVDMETLGRRTLALTRSVASGQRTCGERSGHSQVQLWRDWPRTDASCLAHLLARPDVRGPAMALEGDAPPPCRIQAWEGSRGPVFERLGLVLPTSLCSAQVAVRAAERLNTSRAAAGHGLRRFVALAHTEGCGGTADALLTRALLSYLQHPSVQLALVLEHGCEKIHNDHVCRQLMSLGIDTGRFGWASVQLDGGNQRVLEQVDAWFIRRMADLPTPVLTQADLGHVRLGILGDVVPPIAAAAALERVARWVVGAGGTVVLADGFDLPGLKEGSSARAVPVSLSWGGQASAPGLYVAEMPTRQWLEMVTGLAGGVDILLGYAGRHPLQGHPLVPLVQVSASPHVRENCAADMDLILADDPQGWSAEIVELLVDVLSRRRQTRAAVQGNVGFQITRGELGVSL